MAQHPLINAVIYLAQFDVSADHNVIRVPVGVDSLDRTTFGQTTRIHTAGLRTGEITGEGFLDYGTSPDLIEKILSDRVGLANIPLSVMAEGGDANERAIFTKALMASIAPVGGPVGEMHRFSLRAQPSKAALVRGTVLAAKAARTTTGNSGTAQQLGAVAANQRVWAALHVFAAAGTSPTLAVTVRSDDAVGFASPTTRITFTTATGVTSEFLSTVGAITDDFWRVDWTIGGTSPSFTFAVMVGIQ